MGQKVHPKGLRLGIIKSWDGRWYADRGYSELLHEDILIRRFIKEELADAGVSQIEIEKTANRVKVIIHTSKPGIVIGRRGAGVDELKVKLEKLVNPGGEKGPGKLTKKQVQVSIQEIKQPDLDAKLVAENVAAQLAKRFPFRRAMKQAIDRSLRAGAKGIKIACSGRLGGAEIARSEGQKAGKIPLHTLRADIDYALTEAFTTYGQIGVKVWIYKGEVLPEVKQDANAQKS